MPIANMSKTDISVIDLPTIDVSTALNRPFLFHIWTSFRFSTYKTGNIRTVATSVPMVDMLAIDLPAANKFFSSHI